MTLRIFDEDKTPQRYPLLKLLGVVVASCGPSVRQWDLSHVRGYGLNVNELDRRLDAAGSVQLDVGRLAELIVGVDEWVYDLAATSSDEAVEFGLVDSSFMFVDGPVELLDSVRACFGRVEAFE